MRQYLIIGQGVAGVSAAEAIRKADPTGRILMLGDDPHGYYSRPGLAYYLTGEIPEKAIFPLHESHFTNLNLQRSHGRVVKIHTFKHQIELENGKRLAYDRLLLATGASANMPDLPGIRLDGVFKLDHLEDARRITRLARQARSAVVVGGGITALEIVEGLCTQKVQVHYFLRGDRYWSNVLDETESRIIEERLRQEHVQLHYHTEIEEILGPKGKVSGVRTRDEKELACEMVGVAVGIRPRIDLARGAGLKVDKGILVNEYLQTSDPDIFAAGDVAQAYDALTGQHILDSLWNPARDQGYSAGLNMAGIAYQYRKEKALNVTRLAGLTTTIIGPVGRGEDRDVLGIARGDSEGWRSLPVQDVFETPSVLARQEQNRLRIMVGEDRLVGAVIMGDQSLSRPVQELIHHQVDTTSIRDKLLQPGAPIAELLLNFWQQWKEAKLAA